MKALLNYNDVQKKAAHKFLTKWFSSPFEQQNLKIEQADLWDNFSWNICRSGFQKHNWDLFRPDAKKHEP